MMAIGSTCMMALLIIIAAASSGTATPSQSIIPLPMWSFAGSSCTVSFSGCNSLSRANSVNSTNGGFALDVTIIGNSWNSDEYISIQQQIVDITDAVVALKASRINISIFTDLSDNCLGVNPTALFVGATRDANGTFWPSPYNASCTCPPRWGSCLWCTGNASQNCDFNIACGSFAALPNVPPIMSYSPPENSGQGFASAALPLDVVVGGGRLLLLVGPPINDYEMGCSWGDGASLIASFDVSLY